MPLAVQWQTPGKHSSLLPQPLEPSPQLTEGGGDSGPVGLSLFARGPQEHINPADSPHLRDVLFMQSEPGFMRRLGPARGGLHPQTGPTLSAVGVFCRLPALGQTGIWQWRSSSWLLPAGHLLVQGSSRGSHKDLQCTEEQGHRRRSKIRECDLRPSGLGIWLLPSPD